MVGRIFFSLFFPHKLSITFVLHAIFFFRQALAGNFFSNSPTPPPQELNGRPLRFEDENDYEYKISFDVFFEYCKKIATLECFIVLFFTRKVSTVIFIREG